MQKKRDADMQIQMDEAQQRREKQQKGDPAKGISKLRDSKGFGKVSKKDILHEQLKKDQKHFNRVMRSFANI
jgi:transposase